MKKKLMIFGTFLIVFMAILYVFMPNERVATFFPDENLSALIDVKTALEADGYQVEVAQTAKEILQGERYQLLLNDDEDAVVTVYVYGSVEQAEEDANTITEDGCGIDRVGTLGMAESIRISWVDAPHFFLYENVIVQYIGMDFDLLQCLYRCCGKQIAGQPFIDSPLIEYAMLPKEAQYFPGNDVQVYSYPLRVEKSVDNC